MHLQSETPFGWKVQNGVFIKNDLEQWVIQRIQEEERLGKSLDEITQDLIKVGIKPRNGGIWFPRRIKKVLAENEKLRGSLIPEVQSPETQVTAPSATAVAEGSPAVDPSLKRAIRPGAVDYQIRESCQTLEKCNHEASQRSIEVGKIITRALLLAAPEKRRKKVIMEEESNELQNRDLRAGQHGRAGAIEGGIDRLPEA